MDNGGFFSGLFDLSFRKFVFPKLIKVLYVLAIILAALAGLGFLIGGLKTGGILGVVQVVLSPVVFIFAVIYTRVFMEVLIVMFRIEEHVREIARHK